jgi:hypothetical protein
MPEPSYPTTKGIWGGGRRAAPGSAGLRLGTPYPEAVAHFRRAIEGRSDFDPAMLLVWGTMQATGVLNILKAVEARYGRQGQDLVREAINRAGYEAMEGLLADSVFPEEIDEMTLASFIVTGMNTVIYASLEDPWVTDETRCEFNILWCPHQDRYTAFDCRVQRYFVEGMIAAVDDAGHTAMTAWVDRLIPHGADHCHFVVEQRDPTAGNPWHAYSDELAARALDMLDEPGG